MLVAQNVTHRGKKVAWKMKSSLKVTKQSVLRITRIWALSPTHFPFLFSFFFTARAEAYKEDGNYEYNRKQFKEAIVAYTEGIKIKCDNPSLNAILYTNRATAQLCLGKSV